MSLYDFLKVFHIIVSLLLILVVLMQNKNANLNLASMSSGMNAVTRRWPEKVLHQATIILGFLFVSISILFFVLY